MDRVLACIDGSNYFASVCDHAAWAAKRTGAAVELLHVLGRREVSSVPGDLSGSLAADEQSALLAELAEYDAARAKLTQRRGRALLDEAKARLAGARVPVEARLRNDGLVEAVQGSEANARLVVIGKRGEASGFASGHLGSNLERVVRSSHRPILVASRAYRPIERLLLAYDGSPGSTRAIEFAARDPLLRGLRCHVITAGAEDATTRARLADAVARLHASGVQATGAIVAGEPEVAIPTAAEEHASDCIVMGAYGHSRVRNLIVGSTTTAVVRAAHLPILTVR